MLWNNSRGGTSSRSTTAGEREIAAWAAAGLYGFGELLWSQAIIAEVYGLNVLLVAMLLAVALYAPARARPYTLALLFGLGLAHHRTIVLLLPALWPYVSVLRRWLTARRSLLIGSCLLFGLLTYLYIPLRASTHPVPNWGQADGLSSFIWLVSGTAYRQYLGAVPPSHWLQRLSAWAGIWVRDLGVLGLALALLGLWHGLEADRKFTWFGLTYVGLLTGYAMLYVTPDSYLYLLPAAAIIALWIARGAIILLQGVEKGVSSRLAAVAAALILLALPLASLVSRFPAMDLSTDRAAYTFAQDVLAAAPHALVISNGDVQTFPLWYLRYGLGKRPDVAVVDRSLLAFAWYREGLVAQHPELTAVTKAHDAQEAITILVLEEGPSRSIHLIYADDYLLQLAVWSYEDPLFTLSRE